MPAAVPAGPVLTARTRAEREWLEIVADLVAAPPAVLPDEPIALQLCRTFGLTACSYNDVAPGRHDLRLWPEEQQFGGLRADLTEWAERRSHLDHPLLRFYLATARRVPMQTADLPVADVRRRRRATEILRAVGAPNQFALPLWLGPGRNRSFVMGRPEVFGEAEVRLVHLLWRLLTGVDRQLQALARCPGASDVMEDLRLTPRELAVLALLVEGHTAAAIGRRLTIGERTVQKHLEHTYRKLGVRDRLSAVLRAQDLGLLPARG